MTVNGLSYYCYTFRTRPFTLVYSKRGVCLRSIRRSYVKEAYIAVSVYLYIYGNVFC